VDGTLVGTIIEVLFMIVFFKKMDRLLHRLIMKGKTENCSHPPGPLQRGS